MEAIALEMDKNGPYWIKWQVGLTKGIHRDLLGGNPAGISSILQGNGEGRSKRWESFWFLIHFGFYTE